MTSTDARDTSAERGEDPATDAASRDPRAYDPLSLVDRWLPVWEEQRLFQAGGDDDPRPRAYVVDMFPYPSGDLHMGHAEAFSIGDAIARFLSMRGNNVLHPIGWDSFGLPAENAAIKRNMDPREWTYANIEVQAESFRRMGISFDWRTRLHTSDPEYYRWTQWLFLRLFEKGLAYRKASPVNWCPNDQTVLANEQVVGGRCERCDAEVTKRNLTQWFFKITDYADRLLDDMSALHGKWPERVLTMQRNWIGRSTGAYVDFAIEGREAPVRVFTTRPDTMYGATFFVVAADSALAEELASGGSAEPAFVAYRKQVKALSDIDRLATDRPKTGVFLDRYAVNPVNGARIPVYAADYVLADYGTGAVMAVPAHDQRDLDFARPFDLPVQVVVDTGEDDPAVTSVATTGDGTVVNSGPYNGLDKAAAIEAVTEDLLRNGHGDAAVTYRLRDWLLSRQRYWGAPIPIVHCASCGEVAVPDEQLPVRLPESGYSLRPEGGQSPLESASDWVSTACPQCGEPARRDTDTMDTFVDSSWYFLRYSSAADDTQPFDREQLRRWAPVDRYVGGVEHAILHCLYSRFLIKVLHDLGYLDFVEPFSALTNQGQVIMNGAAMSKSKGNLVDLQRELAQHGPDAVRVTMLFAGPPEEDIDWADVSIAGAGKWLARVWRLAGDVCSADVGSGSGGGDAAAAPSGESELRRTVHRMVDETTRLMEASRFNVAIARLMELTTVVRRAFDNGAAGPAADPDVREGAEALVRMLSVFAPFTAEDAWARLGRPASVVNAGWPEADPALVHRQTVTCVVQVKGKVRDRLEVPADIGEDALRELALASEAVTRSLAGAGIRTVIVRPPKLVNVVPS
ncbi:MAG: leucine--tRNA ligase [Actinomycetota bacterium]|nr:leucine--tRNA ligase [Actinomycetota bacterium]